MLCGLCRMRNTLQQSNNSKVWNTVATTRFRTEAVRDLFNKIKEVKTMLGDAISIEKIRCGTYFIENRQKEENWYALCSENVMSALYWLWKEEVTHSKLNSLLKLLESIWVEKVTIFKKLSSRGLRELISILGSQVKQNLIKRIKKSALFGVLTDKVTDIANTQNLLTLIKFYDEEKWKAKAAFIDSIDLLHFSETMQPMQKQYAIVWSIWSLD